MALLPSPRSDLLRLPTHPRRLHPDPTRYDLRKLKPCLSRTRRPLIYLPGGLKRHPRGPPVHSFTSTAAAPDPQPVPLPTHATPHSRQQTPKADASSQHVIDVLAVGYSERYILRPEVQESRQWLELQKNRSCWRLS